MKKSTSGFTIVELLIVIVVIGILAAITIVAFNGIQNRAENTKTTQAIASVAKALQLYRTDNNDYPASSANGCVGTSSTYTDSYGGRCWSPNTSSWIVNGNLATALTDYIKALPEPSNKNTHSDTEQYRGVLYQYVNATDVRLYGSFLGIPSCPSVASVSNIATYARSNGISCVYRLPT